MDEQDYINATNLAKLRIIEHLMRDLFGIDMKHEIERVAEEVNKLEKEMD